VGVNRAVIGLLCFSKAGERTFYVHGFAKSDTANISKKELVRAKKQAKTLFAMTDTQIQTALNERVFEEIRRD